MFTQSCLNFPASNPGHSVLHEDDVDYDDKDDDDDDRPPSVLRDDDDNDNDDSHPLGHRVFCKAQKSWSRESFWRRPTDTAGQAKWRQVALTPRWAGMAGWWGGLAVLFMWKTDVWLAWTEED